MKMSLYVLYNKRWKRGLRPAKTVFRIIKLQEGDWAVTAFTFLSILYTEETDRGRKGDKSSSLKVIKKPW